MGELKGAQARHQPVGGEGVHHSDGENALGRLAQRGKGGIQALERLAHLRRQPPAHLGQDDSTRLAQEQGRADPIFQQLHLIADGRLGHAELLGGLGEAAEAGGGLEGADGSERRQARHGGP